jgi:hypothetical protein
VAGRKHLTTPRRILIALALVTGLASTGYGIAAAASPTPKTTPGSPTSPAPTPAPTHRCPNM